MPGVGDSDDERARRVVASPLSSMDGCPQHRGCTECRVICFAGKCWTQNARAGWGDFAGPADAAVDADVRRGDLWAGGSPVPDTRDLHAPLDGDGPTGPGQGAGERACAVDRSRDGSGSGRRHQGPRGSATGGRHRAPSHRYGWRHARCRRGAPQAAPRGAGRGAGCAAGAAGRAGVRLPRTACGRPSRTGPGRSGNRHAPRADPHRGRDAAASAAA